MHAGMPRGDLGIGGGVGGGGDSYSDEASL